MIHVMINVRTTAKFVGVCVSFVFVSMIHVMTHVRTTAKFVGVCVSFVFVSMIHISNWCMCVIPFANEPY